MSSDSILYSPYTLPCGVTARNRLVKAAMGENMSSMEIFPEVFVLTLSILGPRQFRHGDPGNVMVDKAP